MNKYRRFSVLCHLATALLVVALADSIVLPKRTAFAGEIERPADAIEVFHCAFDDAWDANYDEWPDRWTRKTGEYYPHYVDVHMRESDDPQAADGRLLEIGLDGASALVASPPIRVTSRFSYLLTARVKTVGLKYSTVTLWIDFYNSSNKLVQSRSQELAARPDGWSTISMESIDPGDDSIDRAVISLDVRRSSSRGDLKGVVSLDDVWLARLPRITVTTNCPYNVYPNKDDVVVRCELSGIREQNPEIRFQLLDASSNELHGGSILLNGRLIEEDTRKASDIVDGVGNAPKGYEGVTEWRPKIPRHGFYSVVVTMLSSDSSGKQSEDERKMDRRVIWLAAVAPMPKAAEGDFGWSLAKLDQPFAIADLTGLLPNVGINWVKFPAWYDVTQPRRGDEIIRFVEMLGASNIEVVGVIDRPPAGTELAGRLGADSTIANLLSFDPAVWLPALDPVMSRLSMRLRYWQFGSDSDTSLVGFPNLAARISEIHSRMFRFGQQVNFGLPWLWDGTGQLPSAVSWNFEQLTPDPSLSLAKFEAFVSRPRTSSTRRWITIEPPAHVEGSPLNNKLDQLNARATDFVRKLVAAKQHGVDAIIVSKPFDDRVGLMRANGMPAELLLPWRTTAAMLSGAKYLGSVQLPGGSENRNFLRPDGRVVMVVWNSARQQESLFLGNDAEQIDIWGGATPLPVNDYQQVVEVGPVPTFVLGVSEPIVRWRMSAQFKNDHVESIFGKPHPNALYFQNCFRQGVGGKISIVAPQSRDDVPRSGDAAEGLIRESDRWSFEPPEKTFSLQAGETATFPCEILLKNALFGAQPVRIDVVVDADDQYHFSIYRTMYVGSGDIAIDFKTHLDKDGMLIVEQSMTNTAKEPVDFKCFLYAKGYRRQRSQVYRLGSTPDRTTYRYRNGNELLGKELTFEAEEINGERVLKHRFRVVDQPLTEPGPPPPPKPAAANPQAGRVPAPDEQDSV